MHLKHLVLTFILAGFFLGCSEPEGTGGTTPVTEPEAKKPAEEKPVAEPVAPPILVEPALWTSGELANTECNKYLEQVQVLRKEILEQPKERTVENTLVPMNRLRLALDRILPMTDLMRELHPDEAVRKAAEQCEVKAKKLLSDLKLDRELFLAISAVSEIDPSEPLTVRFREHLLREYRLAGVDKDDAAREKLAQLNAEMVKLGQEFSRNIREGRRVIPILAKELADMPADFLKTRPVDEKGFIAISTDAPDFFPVVSYARSEKAREQITRVYLSRAKMENDEVLKKLLTARHQYALLLGFPDFASYIVSDKMAKEKQTVADFIDRVATLARPRMQTDLAAVLQAKKKDNRRAKTVEVWDRFYYVKKIQESRFGVDPRQVRQYFGVNRVKDGILKLTEDLYNVKFNRVMGAKTWHESVEVYELVDRGQVLGRMYLDLHPRPNKYGHAAVFPIYTGVKDIQLPSAALVTNFPPGEDGFLEFSDVSLFFHEFGHLIHHLFAGNHRWVTQGGINCEWDFVEVPSHLYEEWAMSHDILARFARHPETGDPIPKDLVDRLVAAQEFGKGMHVMRQMFFAAMSLQFHSTAPESLDLPKLLAEIQKKYSPYPLVKDTLEYAGFGHLDGYSAMYYTYMWSMVIVKDLFEHFREHGLTDSDTFMSWRNLVLAPGGSVDADRMVQNFLGRPYSFDAFQKWLTAQ